MSKNYKVKHEKEETTLDNSNQLSKKEEYDLNKQKKEKEKENKKKKNNLNKKKKRKKVQTNLGARIFAIIMLILMIGSIIATIATYVMK